MSDKKRCSVRKLCSEVHGAVFDKEAFMIPSTTRWHVNTCDEIGRSITSNLENYVVIYMVPCLITRHS
jgi:hypothetical protein